MANGYKRYKREKQDRELRVINDGLVKLMKFEQQYNGKPYTKEKGSFALELFGHKCVICMSYQPNTKDWTKADGKKPSGFVNFAVCEEGGSNGGRTW